MDARSELDLRIGAALTRFQTMQFQDKFAELDSVISFGNYCRFNLRALLLKTLINVKR